MTYEIKNADLFNMFGDRAGTLLRRRSRSIVWPGRAVAVPEIPFRTYAEIMRNTFRDADAANKRAEEFINELNGQRGLGNLVQPEKLPGREYRWPRTTDEQRQAAERSGNDVRPVDNEQARQVATSRREACKNILCWEFTRPDRCLDRQRAGTCPTQSGSDRRFDTSRVQSPGRKPA